MKLYCKIDDESEIRPSLFFLMTSHHPPCQLNRTWQISLFGHLLFICTRCLGQYLGIIFAVVMMAISGFQVNQLLEALIFYVLLPIPVIIDWLTQTLRWRESANPIRVLTGFLFGLSLGATIMSVLTWNLPMLIVSFVSYGFYLVIGLWILKRFQVIDQYLAPYEEFVSSLGHQNTNL